MIPHLEPSWHAVMQPELQKPYWDKLMKFIERAYCQSICFPEIKNIFRAFEITPLDQVKVVILGQDPYHTPGAAMGLSFSIPNGSKSQPSLKNIFKELASDLDIHRTHTDLSDWGKQGILLLNSVLTVENGKPASHQKQGWEIFTDGIISAISQEKSHVVFVLWGNYAISKKHLIDESRHKVITSPHPSPFSAYTGFYGSKPFQQIDQYLIHTDQSPILWN